jgi:hypothetical protein
MQIELGISEIRGASYFPSFLELRGRAEQALVSVVGDAMSPAPPTPQGRAGVESLGLRVSKSVSRV